MWTFDTGSPNKVRALLQAGVNVNAREIDIVGKTALSMASENYNTEIVRILLDANADTEITDFWQTTPLMHCCGAMRMLSDVPSTPEGVPASLAVVQMLLQNGANLNAVDERGWTPLHIACHVNKKVFII